MPTDPGWLDQLQTDPLPALMFLGLLYLAWRMRRHEDGCEQHRAEADRKLTTLCEGQGQIKTDISEVKDSLKAGERRFDAIERGLPRRYTRRN